MQSGRDVTFEDGQIRRHKKLVVKYEEEIKQHQQRLLEMEQEEGWSLDRLVCKLSNMQTFVTLLSYVCRALSACIVCAHGVDTL